MNKNKTPNAQAQLAQILQTSDPAQQLQTVQQLIQTVNAPSLAVTLVVAPNGAVTGISTTLQLEAFQIMAILANGQQVLSAELEKARRKAEEPKPASTQATPPTLGTVCTANGIP